jgi:hypothetical protein
VAIPEDDVSRFLFGLYRDAGAIRVRRESQLALGQVEEAHTRRVIEAWTAAARPVDAAAAAEPELAVLAVRRVSLRRRLRGALGRLTGRAHGAHPPALRPSR